MVLNGIERYWFLATVLKVLMVWNGTDCINCTQWYWLYGMVSIYMSLVWNGMELLEAGIKLKQGQHEVLFFTTKPHRSHTDMICIHTPSLLGGETASVPRWVWSLWWYGTVCNGNKYPPPKIEKQRVFDPFFEHQLIFTCHQCATQRSHHTENQK